MNHNFVKSPQYSISLVVKGFVFLFKILWILFVETTKYTFFFYKGYEEFIVSLINRLIKTNILGVKILQAISLNNNIFNDKINNTLIRFVNNAPWTNEEIDYSVLKILKKNHDIILDHPLIPVNSGMISLVFKGKKISTGQQIIVKMKRQNIDNILNSSIDDLVSFMNIIIIFPFMNKFQIVETIANNMDLIKHQTNFSQEVKNIQIFEKICKHLKYIKIPNVDVAITETYDNIILMEYIDGVTIDKIEPDDYIDFAKVVTKFVFVTTFLYGKMHGDLHSGNILFIKDNNSNNKYKYKLGILDFGLIYEINSETKNGLFSIMSNLYNVPIRELAEIIINSSLIEPVSHIKMLDKEPYDNIVSIISEFSEKNVRQNDKLDQMDIYKFLNELNSYLDNINLKQNKIMLKPSDDFVKIQVLFGMMHGVIIKLCGGKYMKLSNEVLNELFNPDKKEKEKDI